MVSVLVVGLASLRPLLCFNWALFASVLVLAWLRCPTIVVFTGPCLLLLVMVLVLVVVCEVCCGTTIVLVSVVCFWACCGLVLVKLCCCSMVPVLVVGLASLRPLLVVLSGLCVLPCLLPGALKRMVCGMCGCGNGVGVGCCM